MQDLTHKIMESVQSADMFKKQFAQIHRIDLEKWVEGERLHRDPGGEYVEAWVKEHAAEFHEMFTFSDCRTCKRCFDCGSQSIKVCTNYEPDLSEQTKHILEKVLYLIEQAVVPTSEIRTHYGL